MPQNKFALARYYLIDALLHRYKYVKTSIIVDYCEKKTGYKVSRRTIQMDIEAMSNDSFLGFYAPIEYSNTEKAYYYKDLSYKLSPFSFTYDDIIILESILFQNEDAISQEQGLLLKYIIEKMRRYVFEY